MEREDRISLGGGGGGETHPSMEQPRLKRKGRRKEKKERKN